jgi:hypothetical protein
MEPLEAVISIRFSGSYKMEFIREFENPSQKILNLAAVKHRTVQVTRLPL